MADLAAFYAAQRPQAGRPSPSRQKLEAGRQLAPAAPLRLLPPAGPRHEQVPRLAGNLAYLVKLLRGFKGQTAGDLDGTMTTAAQPLSEAGHREPRALHATLLRCPRRRDEWPVAKADQWLFFPAPPRVRESL